ncbi:FAD-binding protein [Mycolicibacterium goodii]|uniref:FAD-dependent oxidoreductase 2 FAD-binding domain-containing protein n=1 Tax=Mycolicibacterium goodii TaxID=134601 RepID=A0A0K0XH37_MYCGD|nr:hypothetical protein AFA91_28280 [Mycolicibacterium goodii]
MWDDELDVVCCGSGSGALAAAIAAADADLDVDIARGTRPSAGPSGSAAPWLGRGIDDPETREYLDELVADQDPSLKDSGDTDIEVRTLRRLSPASPRTPVATFRGADLRDWAGQCLRSPYGLLYTRLTERGGMPMETDAGEIIEAKVLGSIGIAAGAVASAAVNDWLLTQVRERDIPSFDDTALERIVFEEGEIVGVVLTTPSGSRNVRVRHGVAMSTDVGTAGAETTRRFETAQTLRVALVGRGASRFSRVELLTTSPDGRRADLALGDGEPRSHARSS